MKNLTCLLPENGTKWMGKYFIVATLDEQIQTGPKSDLTINWGSFK
jgi:hypothetical protein